MIKRSDNNILLMVVCILFYPAMKISEIIILSLEFKVF